MEMIWIGWCYILSSCTELDEVTGLCAAWDKRKRPMAHPSKVVALSEINGFAILQPKWAQLTLAKSLHILQFGIATVQ